jgi:glycosyltransferase involved in cell wall biosynthesis
MNNRPDAAVLIATYNRADLLGETLDGLARVEAPSGLAWEVVVIDNNSKDQTRHVVESRGSSYPVPLRYVFEPRQGRSPALNAGFNATTAPIILYTDDDVRVANEWLRAGYDALIEGSDYVGGPVRPIWGAERPIWLDPGLWGTIAILDYGPERFQFEERRRVPLGANMGVRRELIERIGGFRADLGRSSGRIIMGQEVPELLARARAAGARGLYVPEMAVDHHVPAARLTKQYFRRWWFGKGMSKARLEAIQPVTELGLDLREQPHIGPLPRFMVGTAARDLWTYVRALAAGAPAERFRREMMLTYFTGYLSARLPKATRPKYPGLPADSGVLPHLVGDDHRPVI